MVAGGGGGIFGNDPHLIYEFLCLIQIPILSLVLFGKSHHCGMNESVSLGISTRNSIIQLRNTSDFRKLIVRMLSSRATESASLVFLRDSR